MTITYSLEVSSNRLGGFAKLLVRWRGSIYKLLYREMVIFLCLYYGLAMIYRYALNDAQQTKFENISLYCREYTDMIPLTFVLGFYVSIVVGRWWEIYKCLPWPDRVCMCIASLVSGTNDDGRILRRTLVRYLNQLAILVLAQTSSKVKKRFPTTQHMVSAGIMTENEKVEYENALGANGKWWLPMTWFNNLLLQCRHRGHISADLYVKTIMQVVTIATYAFLLASTMAQQYLYHDQETKGSSVINQYFPLLLIVQFFFYMGWLKVAEVLVNPLGEDDDDFEVNWIIDRNLQFGYYVVDALYDKTPPLEKDIFWDDAAPTMPYTKASVESRTVPFMGSAAEIGLHEQQMQWAPNEDELPTIQEDVENDDAPLLQPARRPNVLRRIFTFPTRKHSNHSRSGQTSSMGRSRSVATTPPSS